MQGSLPEGNGDEVAAQARCRACCDVSGVAFFKFAVDLGEGKSAFGGFAVRTALPGEAFAFPIASARRLCRHGLRGYHVVGRHGHARAALGCGVPVPRHHDAVRGVFGDAEGVPAGQRGGVAGAFDEVTQPETRHGRLDDGAGLPVPAPENRPTRVLRQAHGGAEEGARGVAEGAERVGEAVAPHREHAGIDGVEGDFRVGGLALRRGDAPAERDAAAGQAGLLRQVEREAQALGVAGDIHPGRDALHLFIGAVLGLGHAQEGDGHIAAVRGLQGQLDGLRAGGDGHDLRAQLVADADEGQGVTGAAEGGAEAQAGAVSRALDVRDLLPAARSHEEVVVGLQGDAAPLFIARGEEQGQGVLCAAVLHLVADVDGDALLGVGGHGDVVLLDAAIDGFAELKAVGQLLRLALVRDDLRVHALLVRPGFVALVVREGERAVAVGHAEGARVDVLVLGIEDEALFAVVGQAGVDADIGAGGIVAERGQGKFQFGAASLIEAEPGFDFLDAVQAREFEGLFEAFDGILSAVEEGFGGFGDAVAKRHAGPLEACAVEVGRAHADAGFRRGDDADVKREVALHAVAAEDLAEDVLVVAEGAVGRLNLHQIVAGHVFVARGQLKGGVEGAVFIDGDVAGEHDFAVRASDAQLGAADAGELGVVVIGGLAQDAAQVDGVAGAVDGAIGEGLVVDARRGGGSAAVAGEDDVVLAGFSEDVEAAAGGDGAALREGDGVPLLGEQAAAVGAAAGSVSVALGAVLIAEEADLAAFNEAAVAAAGEQVGAPVRGRHEIRELQQEVLLDVEAVGGHPDGLQRAADGLGGLLAHLDEVEAGLGLAAGESIEAEHDVSAVAGGGVTAGGDALLGVGLSVGQGAAAAGVRSLILRAGGDEAIRLEARGRALGEQLAQVGALQVGVRVAQVLPDHRVTDGGVLAVPAVGGDLQRLAVRGLEEELALALERHDEGLVAALERGPGGGEGDAVFVKLLLLEAALGLGAGGQGDVQINGGVGTGDFHDEASGAVGLRVADALLLGRILRAVIHGIHGLRHDGPRLGAGAVFAEEGAGEAEAVGAAVRALEFPAEAVGAQRGFLPAEAQPDAAEELRNG